MLIVCFVKRRRAKTRLELLQQEQRTMEEKNKRKKALLAKTIAKKCVCKIVVVCVCGCWLTLLPGPLRAGPSRLRLKR